ncbi:glycosyl transferase family 2 [Paenibacillus sp. FSL H8-0548]|uniref:glycosyltransferase n=1 Tax=Paenibacillus sp. FSL H8-0548 TaxID=1920422 RepID=UPI00096F0612|nr:glycosyltransferase [Paenibacillus sp. FSL H8-0548]OMF35952.1 glycosyl transferase family 2 [Paenibacillus sp. FSL H8-0548]
MKPKVSIVVPIYNMEDYLDRCLRSLLRQTLTAIEIIAVNDGSQDASLRLLQQYAEHDSRIVIINKANGGVSAARNDGVKAARGQYIGFVDPDDWVDDRMYEELYHAAIQDHIDIAMCTYIREFESHAKEKHFDMPHKQIYRGEEVQAKLLRRLVGPLKEELASPEFLDAWGTVWSKIYRAEWLKDHGFEFMDLSVIGSNEDTLFNIHAFHYAESFIFLNRPFYHYWRANTESITSTYNAKLPEKFDRLYTAMQSFIVEKQLADDYKTAFNNRICMNIIGLGINMMSEGKASSAGKKLKAVHALLHSNRVSESFRQFDTSYCPLIWKVFFVSAKHKFTFAVYFMLIVINGLRAKSLRRTKVESSSNFASGNHYESRRLRNDADELLSSNGSKPNSV